MKKAISVVLGTLLCATFAFGVTACGKKGDGYSVYAPDGAPALALVNAMRQNDEDFDYHVVDASTIGSTVSWQDEKKAADFCILPVNAAAKMLGNAQNYQMLGTVTNGNFYFLTTGENPALTLENLSSLVGKTVGVLQLNNVPGLTLQTVLLREEIPYAIMGNDGAIDGEKVNLKPFNNGADVSPAAGCDYYMLPEPAHSAKIKGTATSPKPFKTAGSLQTLYGGEEGYPQAVAVVKKSIIAQDKSAVTKFLSYLEGSATYLAAPDTAEILTLLAKYRTADLTPAFTQANLTAEVIANCSVQFTASVNCKAKVNVFLSELIAVNPQVTSTVSDGFYYEG